MDADFRGSDWQRRNSLKKMWRTHSCVLAQTDQTGQALSPDKLFIGSFLWSGDSSRHLFLPHEN
jgi:hypothetical protein